MCCVDPLNPPLIANVDPVAKVFAGATVLVLAGLTLLGVTALDLGLAPLVASVVVFVGALGMTATNAIVVALSILPKENGTVAALNGALQFGIGALASFLVSIMASTDAIPMTLVMAGCGVAAFVSALILKHSTLKKGTSYA